MTPTAQWAVNAMRVDPEEDAHRPWREFAFRENRLPLFLGIVCLSLLSSGTIYAQADGWITAPVSTDSPNQQVPLVDHPTTSQVSIVAERASWEQELRPTSSLNQPVDDTRGESGLDAIDTGGTSPSLQPLPSWLEEVNVGYNRGFVIASEPDPGLDTSGVPFLLRLNGFGQLRETRFDSRSGNPDLNQFQLIRGRLTFSGNAFTPDFRYFIQLDGRSSAGDEFRLLDYFMEFDLGRNWLDLNRNALVFKTGRYKVPFSFARFMSSREFQFSDRSMGSMYFDLNRSMAWGLGGRSQWRGMPLIWETSLYNGFVTGGAETGSFGALDDNFAFSARIFAFPMGDWGAGTLADFDWHETLATRVGAAYAGTTIGREGSTEFNMIRVVDSGNRLGNLLPDAVDEYHVDTFCVDASCKYRGWSATSEYYFRNISGFQGAELPGLFDHGFWLQVGKFVVPRKLELLSRWSRVVGTSGTLGVDHQSADELAGGCVWYFRDQHAKLTVDATWLNGAPINSSALDISAGAIGWLVRTQIQFAF